MQLQVQVTAQGQGRRLHVGPDVRERPCGDDIIMTSRQVNISFTVSRLLIGRFNEHISHITQLLSSVVMETLICV